MLKTSWLCKTSDSCLCFFLQNICVITYVTAKVLHKYNYVCITDCRKLYSFAQSIVRKSVYVCVHDYGKKSWDFVIICFSVGRESWARRSFILLVVEWAVERKEQDMDRPLCQEVQATPGKNKTCLVYLNKLLASWNVSGVLSDRKHLQPIFQAICAKSNGEPCCDWVGPEGAGHFVKMVHNGIEYGDMQLICEAYAILRQGLGLSCDEISSVRKIKHCSCIFSNCFIYLFKHNIMWFILRQPVKLHDMQSLSL